MNGVGALFSPCVCHVFKACDVNNPVCYPPAGPSDAIERASGPSTQTQEEEDLQITLNVPRPPPPSPARVPPSLMPRRPLRAFPLDLLTSPGATHADISMASWRSWLDRAMDGRCWKILWYSCNCKKNTNKLKKTVSLVCRANYFFFSSTR